MEKTEILRRLEEIKNLLKADIVSQEDADLACCKVIWLINEMK
jgi:hypothetical protein